MTFLDKLPDDYILVVECYESRDRNKIHSYLDTNYPDLGHISMLLSEYPHDSMLFKECSSCDNQVFIDFDGHLKDQYYGFCRKCDNFTV